KNGPFESPEELLKVRGVTPALFYGHDGMPGLRDIFSFRQAKQHDDAEKQVNLQNASNSPAVLFALIGDMDAVQDLTATDGAKGNEAAGLDPNVVKGLVITNAAGQVPNIEKYLAIYDEPQIAAT